MSEKLPEVAVAERLAEQTLALTVDAIPAEVLARAEELLIDVVGLCVAARNTDYVQAVIAGVDAGGPCTAIGHTQTFSAEAAALINGTATHGEDFDDTFEGGPVHSSTVIGPAVLAAAERFGCDGRDVLAGFVVGVEMLCRMSLVMVRATKGSATSSEMGTPAARATSAASKAASRTGPPRKR